MPLFKMKQKTKQPKHVIYYHNNFGRNDGPPLYYFEAMKRVGLDVVHTIPDGDTRRVNGDVDYHWWIDYGEDGLPVDQSWRIPQDGGKTIYVASDTHLDNGYRLEKAKQFDYVFFNQKAAVLKYVTQKEAGQQVLWLPHAAEPIAYPHTEQLKKYDVGFIGHIQDTPNHQGMNRVDFLDRMFRAFPNFYFGTRNPQSPAKNLFEDAARGFNQSRIVLNISIRDDLNMRLFEVLCAGAFLLTNELPTLPELFTDGVHLATYNSYDDAVEKARYYLAHDTEREKIAAAGQALVRKNHTYEHRVRKILSLIK